MPVTYQNTSGLGTGWASTCVHCGCEFRSFSVKQIACSEDCRFKHYEGSGDGCWEWKGNHNNNGYGVMVRNVDGKRKVVAAHRESYRRYKGEVPAGMCVMHTCDNPICTNPAHLVIGTWGDNNRDRSQKGRSGSRVYDEAEKAKYSEMNRGSRNSAAKLTEEMAAAIKRGHPELTGQEVGKLYGVCKGLANNIRAGRSWKHV